MNQSIEVSLSKSADKLGYKDKDKFLQVAKKSYNEYVHANPGSCPEYVRTVPTMADGKYTLNFVWCDRPIVVDGDMVIIFTTPNSRDYTTVRRHKFADAGMSFNSEEGEIFLTLDYMDINIKVHSGRLFEWTINAVERLIAGENVTDLRT